MGYDFSLTSYYSVSKGNVEETVKQTGVTQNTSQNSFLTLELRGGIHPRENNLYFYSWNLYYSQLKSDEVTLGEKINPPPAWGLSIHYNRNIENWYASPFVGVDVESFSTFNTDEARINGNSLSFRQHNVSYGTIGLSKSFRIDQVNFFAQASFSYSVYSTSDKTNSLSDENFTGLKYMTYLGFSLSENTLFHMFYKRHIMSGPTELRISRFGIGLGLNIF